MAEYSIDFSDQLIRTADMIVALDKKEISFEGIRTVLYLSWLSCEITLKSILENAGMQINEIKKHNHNLEALLDTVSFRCEIWDVSIERWTSAGSIRGIDVGSKFGYSELTTTGQVIELRSSKYPNEIRYGDKLQDVDPRVAIETARMLLDWVRKNKDSTIRLKQST